MQSDFHLDDTIRELFPPGVISDDDSDEIALFNACAVEFELVLEKMKALSVDQIAEAVVLFGNKKHQKGCVVSVDDNSFYVSNTLDHLNNIGTFVIKSDVNHIQVSNLKNIARRLRAGATCKKPLSIFERDMESINLIESIKHAHIKATYEVIDA